MRLTELNMNRCRRAISRFFRDERGQSTAEYILMLSVVVLLALRFRQKFSAKMNALVDKIGGQLEKATDEDPS